MPKYLGYLGNEELTPHTHKPNNTQPHAKTTCTQQQQHPKKHMHATTTTKTHIHNNNNKGIPTPRTIIGCSPHPPTCMWVGWVFF